MRERFKGVTSHTTYFKLRRTDTGLGKTGLVFGDMTGSYVRSRGSRTAITMATLASPSAAYSSGGFVEVDSSNCPGLYRFDVPDAAFATGVDGVIVSLNASGVFAEDKEFDLTDWNKQVASVPNAAAGATGGLRISSHAGTAQAGGNTTITLAAGASSVDRFYNGQQVTLIGGTGIAQVRTIVDYNGTSKVATVNRAWRTNPDNTSVYSLSGPETMPWPVYQSGVAQAGGASTITLSASAASVDDAYNGLRINVTGGTGAAQTRVITDYVGATQVATVDRAWATNPDNTSVYAVIADNGLATDGAGGLAALAANVITAAAIAANAISATEIADGAITAAKIADGAIDAATFAAGAIDASAIAADAIGSSELAATAATEIANAVLAATITELSVAKPAAQPSLAAAIALLYMAFRNKRITDSNTGKDEVYNDAGTLIAQWDITDAAGVFTRDEAASG